MNEHVVFQKKPMPVEVEAGKTYYWCACGRSQNQPFCDGSHAVTGILPVAYKAELDGQGVFRRLQALDESTRSERRLRVKTL